MRSTTTNNATTNNAKTNVVVTVNDVYAVFAKCVNNRPLKLNYSDAKSQMYCGTNDFSVNMKKSGFVVYMSEHNVDVIKSINNKLVATENASDTTKNRLRCMKVVFDDFAVLKKCINAVINDKFTTETAK